ncbi:MAG TPA: GNAT family N-acetyltransferase [Candidatus Saccharimonadales bacterium]|nr:GNAT family N-acetyltransferase [Candidatus Saccharimonadales bacterium]
MSSVEVRTFRPEDEAGVRAVMLASLGTDEIPGFLASDVERALVRVVPDPGGTVVALEEGLVVGYCTPNHDDLTVLPSARRRGHGRRLVAVALEVARERGQPELQLYVPPHLPASERFAEAVGLRYRSSLWQFQLAPERDVPPPVFPPDVTVRTFDLDLDRELAAWTTFMHAAFEGHPTPMNWTPSVIAHVHSMPDFDPAGILVVRPVHGPDEPVAFARVELLEQDQPAGARLGDVGLIGVLPEWRRRGLGRELLRWGVGELRRRGAGRIELSVEALNDRATRLYQAHGFEPAIEWPHWVLPTGA